MDLDPKAFGLSKAGWNHIQDVFENRHEISWWCWGMLMKGGSRLKCGEEEMKMFSKYFFNNYTVYLLKIILYNLNVYNFT